MSIFKNTQHKGAALEFVKFMTSPEEQELLNKAFNTIPPVKGVPTSAFAKYPELMAVWPQILDKNAVPMALVPSVSAYQTNVGGGIVGLFGKVATGSAVSENDVKAMLQAAQQKMG
jgi:ABC-type glycerol-3-phosphate transport system substrate-binding protein